MANQLEGLRHCSGLGAFFGGGGEGEVEKKKVKTKKKKKKKVFREDSSAENRPGVSGTGPSCPSSAPAL